MGVAYILLKIINFNMIYCIINKYVKICDSLTNNKKNVLLDTIKMYTVNLYNVVKMHIANYNKIKNCLLLKMYILLG